MITPADKIFVSGIDCVAAIGVTSEERTIQQRLSVDVEIETDIRRAADTDSLRDAQDYARVVALVVEIAADRDFHLIETLAESVASRVLNDFPTPRVRVLVRKLTPVLASRVNFVSVEIVRERPQ